jgi:hypothetical protein
MNISLPAPHLVGPSQLTWDQEQLESFMIKETCFLALFSALARVFNGVIILGRRPSHLSIPGAALESPSTRFDIAGCARTRSATKVERRNMEGSATVD